MQIPGVLDDLYAAKAAKRTLGCDVEEGCPVARAVGADGPGGRPAAWPATSTTGSASRRSGRPTAPGRSTARSPGPGRRYLWEVTVYAPTTDQVEVNRVTDPYSVALTLNSTHSVLVDLADKAFRPRAVGEGEAAGGAARGPDDLRAARAGLLDQRHDGPGRQAGHLPRVRRRNGDGRAHLRELEKAGLTTVHLLPTFDIASIQEDRALQETPDCDLASYAPDSDQQQACVDGGRRRGRLQLGLRPAALVDARGVVRGRRDGGARVAEFRTMVGALHADGLQVVLDQVFNHTTASGQSPQSVLDRVVPGYYQRLNATGTVETSTCCQNIATEHAMAQKAMVDSVVTWARDYKVDGFRFDLMGHHSVENMEAIRTALDELTPKKDGVDGKKVYLYGEGWNFGEVATTPSSRRPRRGSWAGRASARSPTGCATRSAAAARSTRTRASRASAPAAAPTRTVTRSTARTADQLARAAHDADLVRLGMAGNLRDYAVPDERGHGPDGATELDYNGQPAGYADSPEEVITYVDAHDNETLWDSLTYKLPSDTPMADRVRMNTVSLATTALAQTPSFWHAGADLLRSKSLDRNSYNSGDWFNLLDLSGQDNGFGRGLPPAADN